MLCVCVLCVYVCVCESAADGIIAMSILPPSSRCRGFFSCDVSALYFRRYNTLLTASFERHSSVLAVSRHQSGSGHCARRGANVSAWPVTYNPAIVLLLIDCHVMLGVGSSEACGAPSVLASADDFPSRWPAVMPVLLASTGSRSDVPLITCLASVKIETYSCIEHHEAGTWRSGTGREIP